MSTGTEWIVDAHGCPAALLGDLEIVRSVCEDVVAELGVHVVGEPLWHRFPEPGGVTGLYLLSESHLACHTWPERGLAAFNLFCCRPRAGFRWKARLKEILGARHVHVRRATRGEPSTARTRTTTKADGAPGGPS